MMRAWLAAAAVAFATIGTAAAQPATERPLRLVLNVGLQNLDPIAGPSFVTRNFAYMVWDTLVAMDGKGEYRPQMLESWQASEDRLTWTFKLRPGLVFSDGAPVTAEDCVTSLRRWGGRDGLGRRLLAAAKDLRATAPDTFVLELARPFGPVVEALGKPSVHVPFIMPARIAAATPSTQQVAEIVGSGPYLFVREEWLPGERTVFRRNPAYRPRPEPADGLAGGKVAHIERMEFLTLTEPSVRVAALRRGEVDYLEYAPIDSIALLRRDRNIVFANPGSIAQIMGAVSVNHLHPPFDNPLVRRALQQVLDQRETVAALGLPDGMGHAQCLSMFMCGGRFGNDAGTGPLREPSLERARALLREAGYNNERVAFMHPADSVLINPMALVVMDRMRRAGFNLDVFTSDWSSIAQRWLSREPVERGGWSVVPVVYTGFDMSDPLSNPGTGYNCTGNVPWSYCDEDMKPLLEAFEAEADPARRREIAAGIQARAHAAATFPLSGQFQSPAAWRAELRNVVDFGFPVMWNIQRAGAAASR